MFEYDEIKSKKNKMDKTIGKRKLQNIGSNGRLSNQVFQLHGIDESDRSRTQKTMDLCGVETHPFELMALSGATSNRLVQAKLTTRNVDASNLQNVIQTVSKRDVSKADWQILQSNGFKVYAERKLGVKNFELWLEVQNKTRILQHLARYQIETQGIEDSLTNTKKNNPSKKLAPITKGKEVAPLADENKFTSSKVNNKLKPVVPPNKIKTTSRNSTNMLQKLASDMYKGSNKIDLSGVTKLLDMHTKKSIGDIVYKTGPRGTEHLGKKYVLKMVATGVDNIERLVQVLVKIKKLNLEQIMGKTIVRLFNTISNYACGRDFIETMSIQLGIIVYEAEIELGKHVNPDKIEDDLTTFEDKPSKQQELAVELAMMNGLGYELYERLLAMLDSAKLSEENLEEGIDVTQENNCLIYALNRNASLTRDEVATIRYQLFDNGVASYGDFIGAGPQAIRIIAQNLGINNITISIQSSESVEDSRYLILPDGSVQEILDLSNPPASGSLIIMNHGNMHFTFDKIQ